MRAPSKLKLPDDAPCPTCGKPRKRMGDGRMRCNPCKNAQARAAYKKRIGPCRQHRLTPEIVEEVWQKHVDPDYYVGLCPTRHQSALSDLSTPGRYRTQDWSSWKQSENS